MTDQTSGDNSIRSVREGGFMSLGEHLDELRRRIIYSLLALIVATGACWFFKDPLLRFIMQPHIQTMRTLGLPETLKAIRYQEGFYAYIKIAIAAGIFLSSPFIIYQLWAFISVALYPRERKWIYRLAPISVGLFLGGMAFGFFVLTPLGLIFLATMGQSLLEPMITIGTYLPMVLTLTIATGLVFELPLVMVFPVKIGILNADKYRKWRKYAIVANLLIAAILTPTPDPFNQMLMALPMILLYEFGILVCQPRLRHILGVAALIGLLAISPIMVSLYGKWQDFRAAKIVGGAGEVARVLPAGLASYVVPEQNTDIGGNAGVDDEWTAGNQMLNLGFGSSAEIKLRSGGRIKIAARRAVRLLAGELWARNSDIEEPFRVLTDEAFFTLRVNEAEFEVVDGGFMATALHGDLIYSQNGGSESKIPEGNEKFFPRTQHAVDVTQKTEWLNNSQSEKKP